MYNLETLKAELAYRHSHLQRPVLYKRVENHEEKQQVNNVPTKCVPNYQSCATC
ncbi:hypothetical protein [Litchfieldia alkalitelluris]|uniref:hypothetical protein n=1 Tax=Litchfieldia alkalitelluris TaxID=304268 RepID=UPI001472B3B3|nr:hypothetical protein [Litchfieldia alkalitelluris]